MFIKRLKTSAYKTSNLRYSLDYKTLGREFIPIGTLSDTQGTTRYGGQVFVTLNPFENTLLDYHRSQVFQSLNEAGNPVNLTTDELSSITMLSHFNHTVSSKHDFLARLTVLDPLTNNTAAQNLHNQDDLLARYQTDITIGETQYNTVLSGLALASFSDVLDRVNMGRNYQ